MIVARNDIIARKLEERFSKTEVVAVIAVEKKSSIQEEKPSIRERWE